MGSSADQQGSRQFYSMCEAELEDCLEEATRELFRRRCFTHQEMLSPPFLVHGKWGSVRTCVARVVDTFMYCSDRMDLELRPSHLPLGASRVSLASTLSSRPSPPHTRAQKFCLCLSFGHAKNNTRSLPSGEIQGPVFWFSDRA